MLSIRASESAAQVEEAAGRGWDVARWDAVVKGELSVRIVPGDHFSIVREPSQVAQVARYLEEAVSATGCRS